MTSLADKVRELIAMDDALPDGAIDAEATAFLEQAGDWPLETQVPLSRVAYVIAAMLLEPNINIRRIVATDAMDLRSSLG